MINESRTILVVDDENIIRQSFCDYFEDNLWRTLPADSGEQALEVLEKESPDCAVVDIRLGGMDGDAFIRQACRLRPEMAFVICTGSPEYDIPADLLAMDCVLSRAFRKPVSEMSELEKALVQLIGEMNRG